MTAPKDQFTQIARQGQDAIANAMRTWTESVQSMMGSGTPAQSGLPSPQQILDNVFDFAEHMLASQREFAKHLLAAGMEANDAATGKAREAVESMSAHTVAATDAATERTVNTAQATDRPRRNR
jgi:BMFP domain-containing protein YqiC